MKRCLPPFLSGVLFTLLLFSLGITALAASGTVEFNTVGILFNGVVITRPGDSYTLANGAQAPSVISYTDEKGGGTTYLPARLLAELMEVEIGWDPATGSVTIGEAAVSQGTEPTLPAGTTAAPGDSDVVVYITDHGAKYHREGCRYLENSQIAITLADAKLRSYEPCAICAPAQ